MRGDMRPSKWRIDGQSVSNTLVGDLRSFDCSGVKLAGSHLAVIHLRVG